MTNSETNAPHCSVSEVTCRRCRMSFRAAPPPVTYDSDGLRVDVTFCSESDCSVPFWHRTHGRGGPAIVGVYPADVVAHRAAWLADIEAGDVA